MSSPRPDARAAIDALQGHEAWALIRRSTRVGGKDTVGLVGGRRWVAESIMDVPLESGPPAPGRTCDRLVAVPFRQVSERGFEAHDDGTPLVVVDVEEEREYSVAEVLDAIPDGEVALADRGGFDIDDDDYAKVVEQIITDEIGQGEGANLVVGRRYRAVVADWSAEKALTVFRRLLEREHGAYWTFCFFTGDRYLVGASPERHVSVHGGEVRMNPISGTFRLPKQVAAPDGAPAADLKRDLLSFLADEKEIYELFMVVDEELKMMCDICHEGGQVLGPFLKPMSHLYGAALAILGRDPEGEPVLDSPIVIRTADVTPDGRLTVTAGATLVRDSDPAYEVAETHAKAGGILSAFGLVDAPATRREELLGLVNDEDVLLALNGRNRRLSTFWLTDQADSEPDPVLAGRRVVILDGEDDFVNMLCHVLGVLGLESSVVRHEDYTEGCLDDADLVIVGPGPGDPRDDADPKMATLRAAVERLLQREQPFLAVCLGHQALCHTLGLPLAYKDIVFQGTQSALKVDGRTERVGFYNTFVGRVGDDTVLPEGVIVDADAETGDVHVLRGPHYTGIQFHAESILTQRGDGLLHEIVARLLG